MTILRRNRSGETIVSATDMVQGHRDNRSSSGTHIKPTDSMPLGVGPIPIPQLGDGSKDVTVILTDHASPTRFLPAAVHCSGVVQDGVVEIEQQAAWQR